MNSSFVLAIEPVSTAFVSKIGTEFPDIDWLDARTEAVQTQWLPTARIVYGRVLPERLPTARNLRWLHVPFAGLPIEFCAAAHAQKITVTNSSGIYNQSIAEHVLGLMIALAKRFDWFWQKQQESSWQPKPDPPLQDLRGGVVAIVGAGRIGQAVARLCRACGMQTLGCRRTPRPTPFFDRIVGAEQLVEMASSADWLVSAVPWTIRTGGMINAAVFAALKPGARFISISRGAVVDEAALIAALQSGRLAGAGLDVTVAEPLPASSPLWRQPNVIITPHVAGNVANDSTAAAELFLRNLHNYRAGLPLENVVDLEEGY